MEFNLPEDKECFKNAFYGIDYLVALENIYRYVRNKRKNEGVLDIDELFGYICECIEDFEM